MLWGGVFSRLFALVLRTGFGLGLVASTSYVVTSLLFYFLATLSQLLLSSCYVVTSLLFHLRATLKHFFISSTLLLLTPCYLMSMLGCGAECASNHYGTVWLRPKCRQNVRNANFSTTVTVV